MTCVMYRFASDKGAGSQCTACIPASVTLVVTCHVDATVRRVIYAIFESMRWIVRLSHPDFWPECVSQKSEFCGA